MRRTTYDWTRIGGALGACVFMCAVALGNEQRTERVLFDFTKSEDQNTWRAVNDGVMGGRSRGQPRIRGAEGKLEFFGTLSLENNGGFSSIRSAAPEMDLSDFDGIAVRFRGDGRTYSFTVSTNYRIMAGSYRTTLPAVGSEWLTAWLPFDGFEATSFGRRLRNAPPLNRNAVRSVGFILADKKAGPFQLEVDWIKAYRNGQAAGDIVDTAVGAGSFQTLTAALKAANLVEALKGKGPFTVFAPTDEAFAKLPAGTVENLLKAENRETLVSVLTYHVVPGRVTSKQVAGLSSAETLSGQSVGIRVSGGKVRVGSATVSQVDVAASNGVIHVIDSVLLPPSKEADSTDSTAGKARRLIEVAVRRGAPMYNHGNKAACAAIYEVAAHGLVAMSADLPGEETWRRMEKALGNLQSDHDMDRRSWALRHMLDDAYRSLSGH